MQTKVEGLLLSKVAYQERHLICRLLQRNGKKIGIIFWGAQGGGKKIKARTLELGHMLKAELTPSRTNAELRSAKEWDPLWVHRNIRLNHKAFCLMCFFLEVADKIALPEDFDHGDKSDTQGVFSVLANGLFQLEKSVGQKTFNAHSSRGLFLAKVLIDQGIFPLRESCILCGIRLGETQHVRLMPEHGGFACPDCEPASRSGRELRCLLGQTALLRYDQLGELQLRHSNVPKDLFHYLCHRLPLESKRFKTLAFL